MAGCGSGVTLLIRAKTCEESLNGGEVRLAAGQAAGSALSPSYRVFMPATRQGTLASLSAPACYIYLSTQARLHTKVGMAAPWLGMAPAWPPLLVTWDWAYLGRWLNWPNRESCDSTSRGMLGCQKLFISFPSSV